MTDEFAVIDRDEDGNPKIARWLDPRDVEVVRQPDGGVRAYLWDQKAQERRLDPSWRLDPLLIGCECRLCRKGRMCADMADMFRRASRHDGELIGDLRRRLSQRESS